MVDSDTTSRAAMRKLRRDEKRRKVDRETIINVLVDQRAGRDFLWWLLQIGKVGTQPFAANALVTSFSCGELNVGQQILAEIIDAAPAGYVRMLQEQADARSDPDTDSDASPGTDSQPDPDSGADT